MEAEEDAGLILYNTCSIRDKAEQKVFNRLNDYKKLYKVGSAFAFWAASPNRKARNLRPRAVCFGGLRICLVPKLPEVYSPGSRRKPYHRPGRPPDRRDLRDRIYGAAEPLPRLHHHHRGLRQVLLLLCRTVYTGKRAQPDLILVLT